MKTNYSFKQLSFYSVLGFLGLAAASCSSYQSASTYDNDGIYGSVPRDSNNNAVYTYNDGNVTQYRDGEVSGQNMNYQEYFRQAGEEYPVFTDTENYSSANDTVVEYQSYNYNNSAGWGEDTSEVTVNLYGGSGWGYPYYGSYWGWDYPYYGGGWGWGLGWKLMVWLEWRLGHRCRLGLGQRMVFSLLLRWLGLGWWLL
jgi:hypothetical protein